MSYISKKFLPNSMSSRPGYTSGRGATISDLDFEKLTYIHDNILKEVGEEASKNFVKMVKNLKVASSTSFLLNLYELESNSWVYTEPKDIDNYVSNEGEAFGTVMSIFGNRGDDTLEIVGEFLSRFGEIHISETNDRIYNSKMKYYYNKRR